MRNNILEGGREGGNMITDVIKWDGIRKLRYRAERLTRSSTDAELGGGGEWNENRANHVIFKKCLNH